MLHVWNYPVFSVSNSLPKGSWKSLTFFRIFHFTMWLKSNMIWLQIIQTTETDVNKASLQSCHFKYNIDLINRWAINTIAVNINTCRKTCLHANWQRWKTNTEWRKQWNLCQLTDYWWNQVKGNIWKQIEKTMGCNVKRKTSLTTEESSSKKFSGFSNEQTRQSVQICRILQEKKKPV